jgi:hypothetical protein
MTDPVTLQVASDRYGFPVPYLCAARSIAGVTEYAVLQQVQYPRRLTHCGPYLRKLLEKLLLVLVL